jgi:hypothetical protein
MYVWVEKDVSAVRMWYYFSLQFSQIASESSVFVSGLWSNKLGDEPL